MAFTHCCLVVFALSFSSITAQAVRGTGVFIPLVGNTDLQGYSQIVLDWNFEVSNPSAVIPSSWSEITKSNPTLQKWINTKTKKTLPLTATWANIWNVGPYMAMDIIFQDTNGLFYYASVVLNNIDDLNMAIGTVQVSLTQDKLNAALEKDGYVLPDALLPANDDSSK